MHRNRIGRVITLAVIGSLAAACSESTEPGVQEQRRIGVLQLEGYVGPALTGGDRDEGVRWDNEPADGVLTPERVIEVPDTVEAGTSFTATVYTIGPSGCWGAAGMDAEKPGARTVRLKPYDVHSGHDVCTMILAILPHETTLTLDEPGEWIIEVEGRRARHGDQEWETPVRARKTIVVR